MSPRISSIEAMTHPLSLNPLRRRWQVIQLLGEAASESGTVTDMTIYGLAGRMVLVQGLQAIERIEALNPTDEEIEQAVDWAISKHLPKVEGE